MRLFLPLIMLFAAVPSGAHAYIDPATGSLILQVLFGAIVTAIATIKLWWHKFKGLFSKEKTTAANPQDSEDTGDV